METLWLRDYQLPKREPSSAVEMAVYDVIDKGQPSGKGGKSCSGHLADFYYAAASQLGKTTGVMALARKEVS